MLQCLFLLFSNVIDNVIYIIFINEEIRFRILQVQVLDFHNSSYRLLQIKSFCFLRSRTFWSYCRRMYKNTLFSQAIHNQTKKDYYYKYLFLNKHFKSANRSNSTQTYDKVHTTRALVFLYDKLHIITSNLQHG